MKTRKLYQILFPAIFIVMGVLMLFGVISINDIICLFESPEGLILGFTAAASVTTETPTTETAAAANSRLLLDSVDKKITQMKPGKTPLDTIMRWTSKVTTEKSWKVVWYTVDVRPLEDTVAVAFDTSAASTVTSNSMGQVHTITVTNGFMWNEDDQILVQGISGGDGNDLVLHITGKSGNVLSVIAMNGTGSDTNDLPDIPSTTKLTRMGPSKAELDASTTPYAIYPDDEYNWHQKRQAQVEQSTISKEHPQEVDFDINDFKAQALFDLRTTAEINLVTGARARKTNPNTGKYVHSMGGIVPFINKSIGYTAGSIDNSTFTDWTKQVFVGNSGSEMRYLFVGKDLMAELQDVDFINKQLEATNTEVEFGITFQKITTNFGQFRVIYHSLFDFMGWASKGLVLDFAHIEKSSMIPLGMRKLDLRAGGTSDSDAWLFTESWCPKVKYGGANGVHAVIEVEDASS